MELIVPFLRDIHSNDNSEWYLANTDYYFKAFDRNAHYIQRLIDLIGEFDHHIAPLKLHQCSFGLMRDQRVKLDDRLYNDFLSGSFTREGKYSGYASYYYQISPEPSSSGGSFLAVGLYRPNKELMDCFRKELIQNPERVHNIISSTGFEPYLKDQLQRLPSKIELDLQYEPYLYMRHIFLIYPLDIEWFYQDDWCEKCAKIFEKCKPFIDLVNDIVDHYRRDSSLPVGHALRPIKRPQRDSSTGSADKALQNIEEED